MSKKYFNKKLVATTMLAAVMSLSTVAFVGGFDKAAAATEMKSWTVTEDAATPMVDKLVVQTKGQVGAYSVTEGKVDQIELDARTGLKMVSKASGVDAVGSEFAFTDVQNEAFELDFRVVSQHTTSGNFGNAARQSTYDDTAATLNPYADVVKATFTFTDAVTGKEVYLSLVSGGPYQIAAVNAYVTTDTMLKYRSKSYDDDGAIFKDKNGTPQMSVQGTGADREFYPARMIRTSFSNAYSYWNTCGNDSVLPSIIGFDPATLQLYGYAREGWSKADTVKKVILDLDDSADMAGWESQFDENSFKNGYTVAFRIDRMTENETEVEYNGEQISYDRYATIMLYEINGEKVTAADVADISYLKMKLDKSSEDVALNAEYVLPVPVVTYKGEEVLFEGTIDVKDPSGETVEYDKLSNSFTPTKNGAYKVTYTMEKENEKAEAILTLNVSDITDPVIALKDGIVNDYTWKSGFTLTVSEEDVTASDDSGTVEVTVTLKDSADAVIENKTIDKIGRYTAVYTAKDSAGNESEVVRTITVSDKTKPEFSAFELPEKVKIGETFTVPTVKATDDVTQNILVNITAKFNGQNVSVKAGDVIKAEETGTYEFTFTATDAAGNTQTVTKTIEVVKSGCNCNGAITVDNVIFAGVFLLAAGAFVVLRKKEKNK